MFENMRMENLITPFETFRVITYNADQTKALYKNKSMQLITGNIYRGETIKEEYNDHCDVYAIYDGIAVGIWIGSVRTDYSVDEVMEHIRRKAWIVWKTTWQLSKPDWKSRIISDLPKSSLSSTLRLNWKTRCGNPERLMRKISIRSA